MSGNSILNNWAVEVIEYLSDIVGGDAMENMELHCTGQLNPSRWVCVAFRKSCLCHDKGMHSLILKSSTVTTKNFNT